MAGAQNRAQTRFVNAKRFKGLGWIQLLPPLSASFMMWRNAHQSYGGPVGPSRR